MTRSKVVRMKFNLFRIFRAKAKNSEVDAMSFEGLNPLLAKQISELETQIGQFAQVQFDLAQERDKMRSEMDDLKKAMANPPKSPDSEPLVAVASELLDEAP